MDGSSPTIELPCRFLVDQEKGASHENRQPLMLQMSWLAPLVVGATLRAGSNSTVQADTMAKRQKASASRPAGSSPRWLAVFAGFALDLKADRRIQGARESSGAIVQAYGWFLDKVYLPLARVEKGSGPETLYTPTSGKSEPVSSIIELRCMLDAGNNRYRERHVPSLPNLSRYVASLSAWLVASCAALIIRRPFSRRA